MRKIVLVTVIFLSQLSIVFAQELKCQVQVISQQIQKSDRTIFEEMQRTIFEFMNNTVFTNHVIKVDERIECSIVITLNEQTGSDSYSGKIQVTTSRPIYNSDYNTPVLNLVDDKFKFRYATQDAIDFNVNSYTSTLSSVLTYYAYLILGFDYDSFGLLSGTQFFNISEKIVVNAQSDPSPGWRSFQDDGKNRAAMIENLENDLYKPLRECNYKYHRLGLDAMTEDNDKARGKIIEALEGLRSLQRKRPDSYLLQLFFETKVDEIVSIFQKANPQNKRRIFNLLSQLDPGRQDEYRKIMQNN
ncbi:MAG: DUF4835 domain-containing protein [Salinivirgaceae bacterium]|nr:MAG: DUF4835 domain-containing protein [Salinivirgaceae bacterium]